MTARLHLKVMGPLRIWRDGAEVDAGPRQQRCLLALLLVRAGRPVTMDDLVDLLWGADPPPSAVNIIHKYVGTLRRLLEPGLPSRSAGSYLQRHSSGYRFTPGPGMLDLSTFRQLVAAAKASLAAQRPAEAFDSYVDALRICHGNTGDALADHPAAKAIFAGVDSDFFAAAVAAAQLAVQVGRPAEVLPPLRLAAGMGRLSEPVHASLVSTLAAAGYQAESLAGFRVIRDRLADELGIDPGRELREARQQVLTGGPAQSPAPARRPPAQLPPEHPLFAGRHAELELLHELWAATRGAPAVIAVDGMAGVGKSALVTRFAHRVASEFPDGQLYLDLQGPEPVTVGDALRALLYALDVRPPDVPDTVEALAGTLRTRTAGSRILVVLDNVRDPSWVRTLLPSAPGSLVLITSRGPLVGLAASDGARLLRAGLPELPQARELLAARLPAARGRDAAVVDEIIELCGRLPLALAVLAARLGARPGLSLESVAAELRDGPRRLDAFAGGRGVRDPRTAFAWSYRQLSPGAARLFRLLSVAFTAGITVEAAAALSGHDPRSTRAELAELAGVALVSEDSDGTFTSHVLVKAYAEELFLAAEAPGLVSLTATP